MMLEFYLLQISQVKCAAPDNEANNVTGVLVCDIGNPLMAQQQVRRMRRSYAAWMQCTRGPERKKERKKENE